MRLGIVRRAIAILPLLLLPAVLLSAAPPSVRGLSASGHELRIDLTWEPGDATAWNIYRASSAEGPSSAPAA